MNLKYADFQDLFAGAADPEAMLGLLRPAVEKLIMPYVRTGNGDGLHITYHAEGSELLAGLAEYLDTVLAEEKYYPVIDRILSLFAVLSDTEIPSAAQIAQMWPAARESLTAREADFHIFFELKADRWGTEISVTGEAGNDEESYVTDWQISCGRDLFILNGKLALRSGLGGETREYPITAAAAWHRGLWDFSLEFPAWRFSITAEGSHADGLGRYSLYYRNPTNRILPYFYAKGSYAVTEDGFSGAADLSYMPGRKGSGQAMMSIMISEGLNDILITDQRHQTVFGLKALTGNEKLSYLSISSDLTDEIRKIVYDGEKGLITTDDMQITVIGAFESDHAYVLTLHPEYTDGRDQPLEDACIRVEYEGGEGNFSILGSVTDSEGNRVGGVRLDCAPTEGIGEKLADRDGIICLTPETILQFAQSGGNQDYPATGR